MKIADVIDLERYPLDRAESVAWKELVTACRARLAADGMFTLEGFVQTPAVDAINDALADDLAHRAFTHARQHNIYFRQVPELPGDHPALHRFETVNHTLCGDQLETNPVSRIYEYPGLSTFLAAVMGKPRLHVMDDPLARVNVMEYRKGEALNWHFDRAEFTTTLLLQAPEMGGEFEYRRDLRTATDPNYDGVARLVTGRDEQVREISLSPGALNVFRGRNTAHRVTPVAGSRSRIIAVFSYFDQPGVTFSATERLGFYGRAE